MGFLSGMRLPDRREARFLVRRLQAGRRVLPDFLIVGAQKSGTSSLFQILHQHPQIRAPFRKEVHFFDGGLEPGTDSWAHGPGWYRAHFPLAAEMAAGALTFEASPAYLVHPDVAGRIAGLMPRVKLVAILRNPTDRALSHYFHNVRANDRRRVKEPLGPAEAMAAEEARLAPILARGAYGEEAFRVFTYKMRGRYLEQLQRYHDHFPRERLLVLRAEDLFEDPAGLTGQLLDFLGLDPLPAGASLAASNVGGNRVAVDPGVRAELDVYFAPHNRALEATLGRSFGWDAVPV